MLSSLGRTTVLAATRRAVLRTCSFPVFPDSARLSVAGVQSRSYAAKGKRGKQKYVDASIVKHTKTNKRIVEIYKDMTAREIADALGEQVDDVSDVLINLDKSNLDIIADEKPIDVEFISKVVAAFDCKPKLVLRPMKKEDSREDDIVPLSPASLSECVRRPPVVTIMGHVDHGKTTLLDALRNSRIAAGEHGGITQHIGAFSVELPSSKRRVTFLDTPGHAAFAAMRERGARATDIVVLVVAADDGVKEQTVQSIKFAEAAGVPLVVAVNKCDKPSADPVRAKRSLLEHGIVPEDMGGDVQCIEVSALHSKNLPALQEALLVQADLMDLKATSKGPVEGIVIESSVMHGIGKVCTVLVTRGTLKKNSHLVAGLAWCRVRTMTDEHGRPVQTAGPSTPVRVSGWREELPNPGETILEAKDAGRAQKCVDFRVAEEMKKKAEKDWEAIEDQRAKEREVYLANRQTLLDKGYRYGSTLRHVVHKKQRILKDQESTDPRLRLIIRSDVEGTLEAILDILSTYKSTACDLQLVDFGVGPPTEKDMELAINTGALVYMFNTQPTPAIRAEGEKNGIRLEQYNVIYRLVEALRGELSAQLPVKTELELVGEGHVLKEFLISDRARKRQPIAGSLVDWGNFHKNCVFRFTRGPEVVFEGEVESLKCDKEVVSNVKTNTEVGIALSDKAIRFKEDDRIEVFEKKEVKQEIDWFPPGF